MASQTEIDYQNIDTSTLDPVLRQILEKAAKDAERAKAEEAARIAGDRKSRMMDWQERQRIRKAKEREERAKTGIEISRTFIQEVAEQYLRFCDREDKKVFDNIRITFIPGKSDQANNSSVAIYDGNKRVSTVYRATLSQMSEKEERLTKRLRESTGFAGSTPIEMLEEIARLQSQLSAVERGRESRMAVCQAAQEVAMAHAEGRDLDDVMERLMEAFQK